MPRSNRGEASGSWASERALLTSDRTLSSSSGSLQTSYRSHQAAGMEFEFVLYDVSTTLEYVSHVTYAHIIARSSDAIESAFMGSILLKAS
jgi:hypothetical protein